MDDVLIVDDDPDIRAVIADVLELEAIPHREAADGREALSRVEEGRPAVVLLDINMPVLDGPGFCTELTARGAREDLALVVMTAGARAEYYRDACGADACVGKPFEIDELLDVIERVRDRHR